MYNNQSISSANEADRASWNAATTINKFKFNELGNTLDLQTQKVLLCIEIERLQTINEELFNELVHSKNIGGGREGAYTEKISILEAQNRTLSELASQNTPSRIKELETRVLLLTNENERLIALNNNNLKEIDHLRMRSSQVLVLEKNQEKTNFLSSEVDRLNGLLASNLRETESWRRKYLELESKITLLISENERINTQSSSQVHEIQDLRMKTSQIVVLEKVQEKASRLSTDVDRLNGMLSNSLRDADTWKARYLELESKIDLLTSDNERLSSTVTHQFKDLEQLHSKTSQLVVLEKTQEKANYLSVEVERLHELLTSKIQEGDDWKTRYIELEDRVTLLIRENERINESFLSLKQESDSQRAHIRDLEGRLVQFGSYESQVKSLTYELERVSSILAEKTKENDRYRLSIYELEKQTSQLNEFEMRVAFFSTEIEKLNTMLNERLRDLSEKNREVDTWKLNFRELEQKVTIVLEENAHLNSAIDIRAQEIESWRNRYYELQQEATDLHDTKMRFKSLENEFKRLEDILQQVSKEKEGLMRRLVELEETKSAIAGLEHKIVLLVAENERLSNGINRREDELAEWRRRYSELDTRVREFGNLEMKLTLLLTEKEKLEHIIEDRRETEDWKMKYVEIERDNMGLSVEVQKSKGMLMMPTPELISSPTKMKD